VGFEGSKGAEKRGTAAGRPGRSWGHSLAGASGWCCRARQLYAQLNLWGTLLGAAFCLPIGRWLDRYGCRAVLLLNLLLLGLVVMWMATVSTWQWLFVGLILTPGLGQSAPSVVSITLVAKWFTGRRLGMAMASSPPAGWPASGRSPACSPSAWP
jgi:MFS family permease